MLSLSVIFSATILCLAGRKRIKGNFMKFLTLGVFNIFMIECLIYIYFLFLIYQGTCFFLIGNQKALDGMIKIRLIYSTYLAQGKRDFMHRVDNDLGYSVGKNKDIGTARTNRQGFRSGHEYPYIPPDNVLRIATFGGSRIWGVGVNNHETWQHYLENSVENLEVLNFGVPGFGVGQSYLRYLKDGIKFNPDIITLDFVEVCDRDNISPVQIFGGRDLRSSDFYRMRFWIDNDILLWKGFKPYDLFDAGFRKKYLYEPVGFLEEKNVWSWKIFSISNIGLFVKRMIYRRHFSKSNMKFKYTKSSEQINVKILEGIFERAKKEHAIVLCYFNKDFNLFPAGVKNVFHAYKENAVYVNFSEAYDRINQANLQKNATHYDAKGNQRYALEILNIFKGQKWGTKNRIFAFDEEKNIFRNSAKDEAF